jgi:hypothetical protein
VERVGLPEAREPEPTPATMKTQPIAFRGRLFTITMPRIGTPMFTSTSATSAALQIPTLLGRSVSRSTNISTTVATSSAMETIPTDQASLRAVHVVMPSPRPGLCAHGAPSGRWPDEEGAPGAPGRP